MTELKGFSRRNNIRLYNVVEGAEKYSMPNFVEGLFKGILENDTDLGIERAHRALASKPPSGAPPRSMVVWFLKFSVKEKVLHATWKKPVNFQGQRVFIDHDYVGEILKRRKEYAPIKKALKEKGIRFQTPYPVKMQVNRRERHGSSLSLSTSRVREKEGNHLGERTFTSERDSGISNGKMEDTESDLTELIVTAVKTLGCYG